MNAAGPSSRRPRIRLIWDELLSHRVAEALRVVGFNVTWVGAAGDSAPSRGSSDAAVIEFAKRTNQIIVTSNHDMMTLCHEAEQRFVWIDPRGRQLKLEEQFLLAFKQISEWERILDENPTKCIRALRTKCDPIEGFEAARLARQRMKAITRRRRSRPSSRPGSGESPLDGLKG